MTKSPFSKMIKFGKLLVRVRIRYFSDKLEEFSGDKNGIVSNTK